MDAYPAVVVGAGQAGLATSHELSLRGVEHVVLERGRVGQSWRDRWDSFCLVTPNWSVRLPGHAYDGDDPDGFMPRDEITAYFERYAAAVRAPVREGVDLRTLERSGDGFVLRTSDGDVRAARVVLACGAYRRPHRPPAAASLPPDVMQLDAGDYRSERDLPPGRVLVVGSGQTGAQIAEELNRAGRDVVLACGKAPWFSRRVGDRDFVWWLLESGFLDVGVDALPAPQARLGANFLVTGHGGGRDLNLRTLQHDGVTLAGRFLGAEGGDAVFAQDLAASVAWGDERRAEIVARFRDFARASGIDEPELPEPEAIRTETPERVDLDDVGCVLFTCGFRPDYPDWLPWPEAFDELGFPLHRDGESTVVPGLHFVGVHFLRKRKSALLLGVGDDAALVADSIAA